MVSRTVYYLSDFYSGKYFVTITTRAYRTGVCVYVIEKNPIELATDKFIIMPAARVKESQSLYFNNGPRVDRIEND